MIETKRLDVHEQDNNNEPAENRFPDFSQSCCSPEFTEGCIEYEPSDS